MARITRCWIHASRVLLNKSEMILEKSESQLFPFDWVDLDSWRDSEARRVVFELEGGYTVEHFTQVFLGLFEELLPQVSVFLDSWWDFCLDTWNIKEDTYDYTLVTKAGASKDYLNILIASGIECGFGGSCDCLDWEAFLKPVVPCITDHLAPYSPLFHSNELNTFFYLHHSWGIGLYCTEKSAWVEQFIADAQRRHRLNVVLG